MHAYARNHARAIVGAVIAFVLSLVALPVRAVAASTLAVTTQDTGHVKIMSSWSDYEANRPPENDKSTWPASDSASLDGAAAVILRPADSYGYLQSLKAADAQGQNVVQLGFTDVTTDNRFKFTDEFKSGNNPLGIKLSGHNENNGNTDIDFGMTFGADVTVTAVYRHRSTVTFYTNYSASDSSVHQTMEGYSGDPIAVTVPVREGYVFKGWATSRLGPVVAGPGEVLKFPDSSTQSYYAIWGTLSPEAATHTISFDANGGEGSMAPQTYEEGRPQALVLNSFVRVGHSFRGWNTSADGTGTAYGDGDTIVVTSDLTLYAQWTPISYTVTLHANHGEDETKRVTVTYGEDTKFITYDIFTWPGHKIVGWNTRPDGSGTNYGPGEYITITRDTDFYAVWADATETPSYGSNTTIPNNPVTPVTAVEESSRIRGGDIQPASSRDRAQDSALPQTGDDGLAALVPVLAFAGAVVLVAGVVARRRQSRHEMPR